MSVKVNNLQEGLDDFNAKEWPRIVAFYGELEQAVLLLRKRKISPRDFCERLAHFGDRKRVFTVFLSNGEAYDLTRTAGGNLIIHAQEASFSVPNMRVWIGLDKASRLAVKKVEAWFVDQKTGKRNYVRGRILYDCGPQLVTIRSLAREVLKDLREIAPSET